METVYKYPIPLEREFQIELPTSASILAVQVQDGQPYLWARVNTATPRVPRRFQLIETGDSLEESHLVHISSFLGVPDRGMMHLFELVPDIEAGKLQLLQLDEKKVLTCCALRFNGWQYVDDFLFDYREALDHYLASGDWDLTPPEQLATFFLLQRALSKWDLADEPENSRHWRAFRSLFFRVYNYEIPEKYRIAEYIDKWNRNYVPRLQQCLDLVRNVHTNVQYED